MIEIILIIIAYFTLFLGALGVLLSPLLLGKDRSKFGYANYVSTLVGFVLHSMLCARVLGWI